MARQSAALRLVKASPQGYIVALRTFAVFWLKARRLG